MRLQEAENAQDGKGGGARKWVDMKSDGAERAGENMKCSGRKQENGRDAVVVRSTVLRGPV